MENLELTSQTDITDELLDYLAAEIEALSTLEDYQINGYMDREILNPDVGKLLNDGTITDFIADEVETVDAIRTMSLSGIYGLKANNKFAERGGRWRRLKEKIRRIFCKVIGGLSNIEELDLKKIIEIVLVAVLTAIGTIINPIILPIVIGIIAYFVKKGFNVVCIA